jgi:hypothetical protein
VFRELDVNTEVPISASSDGMGNPERLLDDMFAELRHFDEVTAQQQRVVVQLLEIRSNRSQRRNFLKIDKVTDWIDSPISQFLWIDGNRVLHRHDFNSSFAIPLLIHGKSSYESVLILRHFCSDGISGETNNYWSLVQGLLRQLFRERPEILKKNVHLVTRDRPEDISKL